jgi:hypothetical protein
LALIRLPTVDISTSRSFPRQFLDERGQRQFLRRLRLLTQILIGLDPDETNSDSSPTYDPATDRRLAFEAIIDTGAPFTVFPRHLWQFFEPMIVRLKLDPDELAERPEGQRTPMGLLSGRHYPYFLGWVWVGAFDDWGRRMPAVPVLAQFREDQPLPTEPQPPLLLGFWGGILDGRRLEREVCLDRRDPDPPHLETFGQRWWLRD